MVRESEQHALSPYMGMTPGGMYFDGTPAGLSISELVHALRRRWLLAAIMGSADLRASGRAGVFGDAR